MICATPFSHRVSEADFDARYNIEQQKYRVQKAPSCPNHIDGLGSKYRM